MPLARSLERLQVYLHARKEIEALKLVSRSDPDGGATRVAANWTVCL